MKKNLLSLLLFVSLAISPATASAAGEPDYQFGHNGNVVTPVPLPGPWTATQVHMDQAPDGGILLGADARVVRYLPTGQIDPGFGHEGLLEVAPPGIARFETADLEVDGEGRIVLIGTAARTSAVGPNRTFAAVLRYLPDGTPDPDFGGGDGVATMDFGLRSRGGLPALAVTASFGAVDGQGRVLLVAGTVERTSSCGEPRRSRRRDRLVARLTADGVLDRSFAGGRALVRPLETVSAASFDRNGIVLAGSPSHRCGGGRETAVVRLHADGRRNRRFGSDGVRQFTGAAAAIAVDRRNRVAVLFKEKLNPHRRNESLFKVVRMLPNGNLDSSFDGNGIVVWINEGPRYRWSRLLIAPDGHLLLVGTLIRILPEEKRHGSLLHRWFTVVPLSESGALVSGFTLRGWISINRFQSGDASATDALVDRDGGLLVAGTARSEKMPRGGIALTRLRLWG
jgi:uncharacterized delta-60 repeat protein